MFNISLLADIEEETVDQAATDEQEEVVNIEDEIVDEAAKEEVADEQPAPAEEVKAEPAAEVAQEEAPVEAEAPKAEEAAPVEKPTEEEITEDAKAEVAEAEEGGDIEVKDTEVLAESQVLSAQFDELLAMQRHVAKFGVDRTFLSLFNKGGRLGRALGVNIPACESIDAVGYPTSPLSMACLEAFGHKEKGVVAKIIDFIVALVKKIKNLAARFWNWIVGLVSGQASKWNKLKLATKNRVVVKSDKSVEVNAAGVSVDPDLKSKLLTQEVTNVAKSFRLQEWIEARNVVGWANGENYRKMEVALTDVANKFGKVTNVRAKEANGVLKTLAKRIEGAFKECDIAKKLLTELDAQVKLAENAVTIAKNKIEKTLNYDASHSESSNRGFMSRSASASGTESKKLSFGTGDKKAVVGAKNALIDLKVRQSVLQKITATYARYIKTMIRSYATVLFGLTTEKA
jgi:hypothetical protein